MPTLVWTGHTSKDKQFLSRTAGISTRRANQSMHCSMIATISETGWTESFQRLWSSIFWFWHSCLWTHMSISSFMENITNVMHSCTNIFAGHRHIWRVSIPCRKSCNPWKWAISLLMTTDICWQQYVIQSRILLVQVLDITHGTILGQVEPYILGPRTVGRHQFGCHGQKKCLRVRHPRGNA